MGDDALLIYPPHGQGATSDADNAEAFAFYQMKKALRETQTLCTGCSKAEPKNFAPRKPPSWGCRTAKI